MPETMSNFIRLALLFVNILGISSTETSNSEVENFKNEVEDIGKGMARLYLPTETISGLPLQPSTYEAFTTAPPSLVISPSSALTISDQSTVGTFVKQEINAQPVSTNAGLCTSETVSTDQLQSKHLLPSKDLSPDSVILSGQIEIASKTGNADSDNAPYIVSGASVQGTQLHVLSTTGV